MAQQNRKQKRCNESSKDSSMLIEPVLCICSTIPMSATPGATGPECQHWMSHNEGYHDYNDASQNKHGYSIA
eukprot:3638820-Rhodomonas_salina.1